MFHMFNMNRLMEAVVAREPMSARLVMMLEPSVISRVDDYRFEKRIGSRAEAVRQLLVSGLNIERIGPAGAATPPGRGSNNSLEENADEHGNR